MADEEQPSRPSSRIIFDKTIQLGTLLSMFTLAVAGIGGGFTIYQGVQVQLYDQKMVTSSALSKIENITVEIRVLRESIGQLKSDQKETDNALRKSLDSIADDLLKVRISLASRGRSSWLRCRASDGDNCWTYPGFTPVDYASTLYPTTPPSYSR